MCPFADAPHLPKVTISHLQLITYGHHSSNKQALRLLQRLAPQWRNIGEILGLHGAVIETIENPGSGTHPEDCMRKVFTKWLENAPQLPRYSHYPLTWRGLHNLLLDSEHSVAATELMEALRSKFTCKAIVNQILPAALQGQMLLPTKWDRHFCVGRNQ